MNRLLWLLTLPLRRPTRTFFSAVEILIVLSVLVAVGDARMTKILVVAVAATIGTMLHASGRHENLAFYAFWIWIGMLIAFGIHEGWLLGLACFAVCACSADSVGWWWNEWRLCTQLRRALRHQA